MQLLQSRRVSHSRKWYRILYFVITAAMVVGSWQAWKTLQPRYRQWKQDRALRQAKQYIEKHDAPNAKMALEVALATVPGNPEAWRTAAELLEQVGSTQAMKMRRQVTQILPDSAEDAAAMVMCALQFREINVARDALSAMTPEVAKKPAALRAALAYALAVNDQAVADLLLETLRAQTPGDEESLRLTQAFLRLRHPQAEAREAARTELERIAEKNAKYAAMIYREFAAQATRDRRYDEAKKWYRRLLAGAGAQFDDRLQLANIELLVDSRPFAEVWAEVAAPADLGEEDNLHLLNWLLIHRKIVEADRWMNGLPAAMQQRARLRAVQVDIAIQRKDWVKLEQLLLAGALGTVKPETVRLVMSAHTLDEAGRTSLRHEIWQVAVESTARELQALSILRRLAAVWGWSEEQEGALWMITRSYPDQTWAYQALLSSYREHKNTRGLQNVMTVLRQSNPGQSRYEHDWALLSILTDPSTSWGPAKEVLKKLYEGDPTHPSYATSYAFALAQSNKGKEALAVVEKLGVAERSYVPRLPYLAYIYGVARAKPQFEEAERLASGGDYLPEERQLVASGREALERKPSGPTLPAGKTKTGDASRRLSP